MVIDVFDALEFIAPKATAFLITRKLHVVLMLSFYDKVFIGCRYFKDPQSGVPFDVTKARIVDFKNLIAI
jgi:hypothetical protein